MSVGAKVFFKEVGYNLITGNELYKNPSEDSWGYRLRDTTSQKTISVNGYSCRCHSFVEHAAVIRPGTKPSRDSLDDPPEMTASLISLRTCFV